MTKTYIRTEYHRKQIALANSKRIVSDATRKKMSDSHKGKHYHSIEFKNRLAQRNRSKEHREKVSKGLLGHKDFTNGKTTGERSYLWQGGITPINKKIRNSVEYKLWRKSVFERDNYTCIWCKVHTGNGKRVELQADHIKPFSLYPELRFAIDNGRTLCRPCHQKTETWGINLTNQLYQ